jgi:predicted nucleotidyltransferase
MGKSIINGPISTALFGKIRQAVLSLLLLNPERRFYLSQIIDHVGAGHGAVQRELKSLADAGLILREKNGHQVYYQCNKKSPVFKELKSLIVKTSGIADVIKSAIEPFEKSIDLAFIYGSFAKGTEAGHSDVDLIAVGAIDSLEFHKAISQCEEILGRTVNYSIMDIVEFNKRRREKNGFLDRVLSGPIILLSGDLDEI